MGADPDKTWSTNGVNWLKDHDMLPSAIPYVRIMRFGYESAWLGRDAVQQRLPLIAEQLLHALRGMRTQQNCLYRPIVFIGHCFGGIVIEKALLLAKLHEEDYPGIFKCTSGIVFLGTPHRGSSFQSPASVIASVASALGLGKKSQILSVLEKDSESLADLVYDFARTVRTGNIEIFCFFEQRESDVSKIVKPQSLDWISYKVIIGRSFSRSSSAYSSVGINAADSNYCYIRAEIKRIVDSAADKSSKPIQGE
ncbi:hypothetical protein AJ80_04405 [Polytolypa hystricis UAMH7299]|uniref:DUF676 domain-containing protein n=1 Tax=Polytolypa hystricis (strain UAMH7299) TaxID=1447883 RepID=A0A2B7YCM5_POLH7|nr:hypothetical protein AJ80_04405 [Polytolypa hystricis UAMH7299]